MLLIVSNTKDLAVDYLILKLEERNVRFFRLNTDSYLRDFYLEFSLSNKPCKASIYSKYRGKIALPDIQAVYFRQPVRPSLSKLVIESHVGFAERESTEVLRSLWRAIDDRIWLNNPKNLFIASNKFSQLLVAQQLGFKVPETLISTDKNSIRRFINRFNGRVVCKAVKHGFFKQHGKTLLAFTRRINTDFLNNLDEYCAIPMVYQQEIKKVYDLRVTVVDDSVFATAIMSQEHAETEVDWRTWDVVSDVNLRHKRVELPHEIEAMCIEITQRFNLRYSAIDMILSEDGSCYFLEMNPNGQWAWIEGITGYPIRDSIIRSLGYATS